MLNIQVNSWKGTLSLLVRAQVTIHVRAPFRRLRKAFHRVLTDYGTL